MQREEFIAKLESSSKVDYLTYMLDRTVVLVMTRNAGLVEALQARGARARWYDRTEWSTKSGKSKADFQCEVLLIDDVFQYEEAA